MSLKLSGNVLNLVCVVNKIILTSVLLCYLNSNSVTIRHLNINKVYF